MFLLSHGEHVRKLKSELTTVNTVHTAMTVAQDYWCCVWCYRGWTIATQYWLAFHYTLFGTCSQWWTRPHGSSSCHQSAITSSRTYINYTGWRSLGG